MDFHGIAVKSRYELEVRCLEDFGKFEVMQDLDSRQAKGLPTSNIIIDGYTREPTIYVNLCFFDAPARVQEAILWHEYGHYFFGHLGSPIESVAQLVAEDIEADSLAIEMGFAAELLESMKSFDPDLSLGPCQTRYEKLKAAV